MTAIISPSRAVSLVKATTFDFFNERNDTIRRSLIQEYWRPDITCHTPFGDFKGYEAMGELWNSLHADEKSEWIFKPRGDLWLNGDVIMQSWTYGNADGMPGMAGWDVIILDGDGLVKELYAMIEGVHTHEFAL
ncbi:hypothetical protein V8C40DRAFT_248573 [Trichoderma camerunense]